MIWLTLRQFRAQAAAVFGVLAALAIVLAVTGPNLANDYSDGIATCTGQGNCSTFTAQFFKDHEVLYLGLVAVVMSVPGVIGLFWGAPLITRELEAGTHRLTWHQSVTRTRWLAVKLGLVGVAAMAAAGLASLAATWWSSPMDKAGAEDFPKFSPMMFDSRGIVPVGYAAFAFALGVTVGMLIRRTLPAMAITLAVFVAAQVAMPLWVRPTHLVEPARVTTAITAANLRGLMMSDDGVRATVKLTDPRAWLIANRTVDATGRVVDKMPNSLAAKCMPAVPPAPPAASAPPSGSGAPPRFGPPEECFAEIGRLGYRQRVDYHPPGRFWRFQWYETTIYLVGAFALSGLCFWWVRRRLS